MVTVLPIYKGLLKRFRGFHVDALFGFFGIGLALFMAWPIAILVGLAFGLRGCIRAKKAIRALTASIKKNLDSRD